MKFNPETMLSKDIIYFPMIRVHLVALQFFGSFPNSTPLKYMCVCVCVCVHVCVSLTHPICYNGLRDGGKNISLYLAE